MACYEHHSNGTNHMTKLNFVSPVEEDAAETKKLVYSINTIDNGNLIPTSDVHCNKDDCNMSSKQSNFPKDLTKPQENGHIPVEAQGGIDQNITTALHIEENDDNSSQSKKHVNVCTDREELDEEEGSNIVETTALRRISETSGSVADQSAISSADGCLTMTGTIKRGKKAGQNVDVKLNISREELEELDAEITARRSSASPRLFVFNALAGPHVLIYTLLFTPMAFLISGIYSFYIGTITWYNIFTYYSEEKPVFCKILVSPFLILFYPFLITFMALGLGIYAAFAQISWYFESWRTEVTDWEKGFFGWLCAVLKHEDCSPYEVVVLTDIQEHELTKVGSNPDSGQEAQ